MAQLIPWMAEFIAGVIVTAIAAWIAEAFTEWFVFVTKDLIAEWVATIFTELFAFFATLLAPA